MNSIPLSAIVLMVWASVAFGSDPRDDSFALYVRVTDATIQDFLKLKQPGDLFWGRDLGEIPKEHRALTVASFANLQERVKRWPADQIAAVNLDAEHRDYDDALEDTRKIREWVDRINRTTKRKEPLRFIAFIHMRIIDEKPDIITFPDVVMVGKSYWNADNIDGKGSDRRGRSAPKYLAAIEKASREPAVLLGDTAKDPHSPEVLVATMQKAINGLGVEHIGFFYPRDNGVNVIEAVRRMRSNGETKG